MPATVTTIANLLKTQYIDAMGEVFEELDGAFKEALKHKVPGEGGATEIPVRVKRNWGQGARGDRARLPEAGQNEWAKYSVSPKWNYQRIEVTGQAMDRSKGGKKKAFLEVFGAESEEGLKAFRKMLNRQTWGSEEGALAVVHSFAGTTVTLKTLSTGYGTSRPGHYYGTNFIFGGEGQKVAFLDASDSYKVIGTGIEVSSVNHSAGTFVLASAPATDPAVDDLVILNPDVANGTAAIRYEMEGILPAIDNNTVTAHGSRATANEYHGLSRSTYSLISSNRVTNSGTLRPFDESLIETLFNKIRRRGGNPLKGGKLYCSLGVHSEFVESQIPLKRFQSKKLAAGYSSLDYSGVDIEPDTDCPPGCMYFLNWDHLKLVVTKDLGWRDFDGKVLARVSDLDSYEARLVFAANAAWVNVHELGVIDDIQETVVTF